MASLKLKVTPKFPAQVLGADGIIITQTGGVYTISIDPVVLPDFTQQLDAAHGGTGQNFSAGSGVLLFTSGTASLLASTGAGNVVRATSPSLTTPSLGVATVASINGNIWTAGTGTLTLGAGKTATINNTLTFNGTDASTISFGTGGTAAYTANKLSVFAATTSAELAGVISDETGSGALVFATSPTLVTPVLGAASATTINGVTLTSGAFSTYTPTITASTGTFTSITGITGRYIKIGRLVIFQVFFTITTNGTAATSIIVSLPATAQSTSLCNGYNWTTAVALTGLIQNSGTVATVVKYDGTYSGATGQSITISGSFEATT